MRKYQNLDLATTVFSAKMRIRYSLGVGFASVGKCLPMTWYSVRRPSISISVLAFDEIVMHVEETAKLSKLKTIVQSGAQMPPGAFSYALLQGTRPLGMSVMGSGTDSGLRCDIAQRKMTICSLHPEFRRERLAVENRGSLPIL